MNPGRAFTGWLGLVLWALAGAALAQQSLRVVLFDIAPFAMSDGRGGHTGLYVERAQALARAAGMVAEIQRVPFARVPLSLKSGDADLSFGFETPAMEAAAERLGVLTTVDLLMVMSRQHSAQDAAGLKGARVGRARGGCQELSTQPGVNWTEVAGFEAGLRMLVVSRIDALCLTREVLDHYAPRAGLSRGDWGREWVVSRPQVHVWVRHDLPPDTRRRLNEALARLAARPTP